MRTRFTAWAAVLTNKVYTRHHDWLHAILFSIWAENITATVRQIQFSSQIPRHDLECLVENDLEPATASQRLVFRPALLSF
jgi:hypothetical protein